MKPSEHLFRDEAGRMVAALTCIFGVHNLALAEDVAQRRLLPGAGGLEIPGQAREPVCMVR